MNKLIIGWALLLGGLIPIHNNVFGARVPDKSAGKTYLQEKMVPVQLPGGRSSKIVKLLTLGETISAVSSDKIFYLEKGQWRVDPIPGNWQTACKDLTGQLWLGWIGTSCYPTGWRGFTTS